MSYELSGTVKVVFELQTFSSGFSKRELVVSVPDGSYTQDISLEFIKDKADLIDDLRVGEQVTISFNIKGREYNGRYYNNLQGWKVVSQNMTNSSENKSEQQTNNPDPFDFGDIPF